MTRKEIDMIKHMLDKLFESIAEGDEPKTELELMKELWKTGDYVCYMHWENKSKLWYEQLMSKENILDAIDRGFYSDIKLIKKGEHEKVAEAVANDSSVEVEFESETSKAFLPLTSAEQFFNNYCEAWTYRLKEPKPKCDRCGDNFHTDEPHVCVAHVTTEEPTVLSDEFFEQNPHIKKSETISISDGDKTEHFAKFGFEVPDFECELWKNIDEVGIVVGYLVDDGVIIPTDWDTDGNSPYTDRFNLTPLKQPTVEEPKSTWWEPEDFDEYFSVTNNAEVVECVWTDGRADEGRLNFGNCYKTKYQAELASKAMRKHNRLLKWVIDYQGKLGGWHTVVYSDEDYKVLRADASREYINGVYMNENTAEALCKALNSNEFCLDSEV